MIKKLLIFLWNLVIIVDFRGIVWNIIVKELIYGVDIESYKLLLNLFNGYLFLWIK